MIEILILDRDGLINHNSSDKGSPFYYIQSASSLVLKPNIKIAFELIRYLSSFHNFKVVLATKQRNVNKGVVDDIHKSLELKLNFGFHDIYVEYEEKNKKKLFEWILKDFNINPSKAILFDDSKEECEVAESLDIKSINTDDLYSSICKYFAIK